MGCVSYSRKYFPGGIVTRSAMKEAELGARNELQPLLAEFSSSNWQQAVGSSGTVRALAELSHENAAADGAITRQGIEKLRSTLIRAGSVEGMHVAGLRADRIPVIPGGLAILNAVLSELDIDELTPATGAMRQGLLYDLLGRVHHHDMRDITVAQFMQRYHVDAGQARRVGMLAQSLYQKLTVDATDTDEHDPTYSDGPRSCTKSASPSLTAAITSTALYILEKADMPGFSRDEQIQVALLVLSHRRSLKKVQDAHRGRGRPARGARAAARRNFLSRPHRHPASDDSGEIYRRPLPCKPRSQLARPQHAHCRGATRGDARMAEDRVRAEDPQLDPASATDAAVTIS